MRYKINSTKKKIVALFDFDGTTIIGDSFLKFILYSNNKRKIFASVFVFCLDLIRFKLRFISNSEIKEKVFSYFFKNWTLEDLENISKRFNQEIISKICRKNIMDRLEWHSALGHEIFIVSASFEFYLKYFCEKQSLRFLGTQIETLNGIVTGKFLSKNCYGPIKVSRILAELDLSDYYVYAYGNSPGDYNMFELANEAYIVKNNKIIKYYKKKIL